MELNEIRKAFYKEDTTAYFQSASKDGLLYQAILMERQEINVWEEKSTREITVVLFQVPLNEIGDVKWEQKIPAKLLTRYILK